LRRKKTTLRRKKNLEKKEKPTLRRKKNNLEPLRRKKQP